MLYFTMKSLVMKDPSCYKLSALHKTRPQRSWLCSASQNESHSLNSTRYTVRQFLQTSFPVSAAYQLSIHIFQHVLIFCFSTLKRCSLPLCSLQPSVATAELKLLWNICLSKLLSDIWKAENPSKNPYV